MHILRNTRAVIQKDKRADAIFLGRGEIDLVGAGIASITEHFDDDILDMLNVVLCLAPLGLRNAEADIPLAKVLLDAKVALPDIDAINEMSSFASLMLFSNIDSAALANHDDLHLAGILAFRFRFDGRYREPNRRLGFIDLLRLNHDVNLATGLHGIGTRSTPVVGVGDFLNFSRRLI